MPSSILLLALIGWFLMLSFKKKNLKVDLLMRGKRQIVWISKIKAIEKIKLRNKSEDFSDMVAELHLMSKVKNIASLQLYGEEQAKRGSSQCQYE
uniref:Protein kinase domain-containing protein n=1 Tax=Brassica oleracea TaxID=3712 RepID=A0A3P6AKU7_BRAOL|nr:unnamed protein product [Brassica oleracea]